MTYKQLRQLKLDTHAKVIVCMDTYQYESTYKWAVNVYTQEFCKKHKIWFKRG